MENTLYTMNPKQSYSMENTLYTMNLTKNDILGSVQKKFLLDEPGYYETVHK